MLDERTILIMMAALQGLLALVAGSLRLGHPDDVRGIGSWALSVGNFALASLLVSFWPSTPFGSRLLISNFFFTIAITLIGFAMARFFGREPRTRRWALAAAMVYLVTAWMTQRADQANLRIAIFSLQIAAVVVIAGLALAHSGELRRGLSGWVVALALSLIGLATSLRFGAAISGAAPVILLSGNSSVMPIFLVLMNIGLALGTLGLILVATQRMRRRLERLASHDALTGLLTRGAFATLAAHAIANARREGQWLGFLLIDLDHFKQLNDAGGHQLGDALLVRAAQLFREQLREVDLVGRYGGEEFAVLLPGADLEQARLAAERIRARIAEQVLDYEGRPWRMTLSIGVAAALAGEAELEALYREADSALYRAKENGRNRVALADAAAVTLRA